MEIIVSKTVLIFVRVAVILLTLIFVVYSYHTLQIEKEEKELSHTEGNIRILTLLSAVIPIVTFILGRFTAK